MKMRRPLAALALMALVVTAAACGGDDDDTSSSSTTSTTEASGADPSEDATTTTLSDDEFATAMGQARAAIEAAGTDLCQLVETPPLQAIPSNPAQVEEWVGFNSDSLEAAATALEGDDPTSAEALRKAAAAFVSAAEEADYALDFLQSAELPEELSSEEYQRATTALQEKITNECDVPTQEGEPGTTIVEGDTPTG